MTTIKVPSFALPVMQAIVQAGGTPYLVGGAVRDALLGLDPKDSDVEAHGLPAGDLLRACFKVGSTNVVGESFGVVKVDVHYGDMVHQVDVSLPRRESKVGVGHTGFLPEFDPTMSVEEAASRRDFTVNSMLATIDGEVIDPFGGQADITRRVLRATNHATFADDPLRVLRGVQLSSRLGFTMDPSTVEACRSLLHEFPALSAERVWIELWKWANGRHPGMGLRVLEQTGWLAAFPILDALRGVPQDPTWHPEGNVWEHTVQAVEWAGVRSMGPIVVLAALLHDVGKPSTTAWTEHDRVTSYGHAEVGAEMAREFLRKAVVGAPDRDLIIRSVPFLVQEHMVHAGTVAPSATAVRRLASRLAEGGATIDQLALLAEADASGRAPASPESPMLGWLRVAQSLQVAHTGPLPLLQGRDLIALGMTPGPAFGPLLKASMEAQLDGEFADTEGAMRWAHLRVFGHE